MTKMTTTKTLEELRNSDVFDSRDLIERIEELETEVEMTDDQDDHDELLGELEALKDFAEEAEGYIPDFRYGESFIRDSYFKEYAQQLADDIGAIDANANWPLSHIDWDSAADELKMDYTSFELDGVTFWAR